jgi:hypothetical protein
VQAKGQAMPHINLAPLRSSTPQNETS